MKWNGRDYRPPMGKRIYPPRQQSIADLLKPYGQKDREPATWVPVLNQPLNVQSPDTSPVPPTSPTPTPTKTSTPTPTPTASATPPASPSPTPTQTGTPTPTPSPSAQVATETFIQRLATTTGASSITLAGNWNQSGTVVLVITQYSSGGNNNINSVTLDGDTMTRATNTYFEFQYGAAYWHTAIYYLDTTSTSGDIVINTAINTQSTNVAVYRLNGLTSTTPVYSSGSYQNNVSSIGLTTTSLADGSVGVGGTAYRDAGACSPTYTNWTRDSNLDGNQLIASSGSFTKTGVGTQSVSASQPCGNQQMMINLAVWR